MEVNDEIKDNILSGTYIDSIDTAQVPQILRERLEEVFSPLIGMSTDQAMSKSLEIIQSLGRVYREHYLPKINVEAESSTKQFRFMRGRQMEVSYVSTDEDRHIVRIEIIKRKFNMRKQRALNREESGCLFIDTYYTGALRGGSE